MEHSLRCNSLKCRTALRDRAVVTTCCHIFCTSCSDNSGMTHPEGADRKCPACQTVLNNPDDAVFTQLNPTEDYKTSVLSGLNPTTIVECAGRGLSFWSYQVTQEIIYQEHTVKSMAERYRHLNSQMDKLINDANVEIESLTQKMSQMSLDNDKMKRDNDALATALREKAKKHQQTQEQLDRLKQREMAAATQSAAYGSVDEVLQQASRSYASNGTRQSTMAPAPAMNVYAHLPTRAGHEIFMTPSQHRIRLGTSAPSHLQMSEERNRRTGLFQKDTGGRATFGQPLAQVPSTKFSRAGPASVGMSAGMKVGSQQGQYGTLGIRNSGGGSPGLVTGSHGPFFQEKNAYH